MINLRIFLLRILAKKCIIYYGEYIDHEDEKQYNRKIFQYEPIMQFDDVTGKQIKSLGKEPEFCCKEIEKDYQYGLEKIHPYSTNKKPGLKIISTNQPIPINFCPHCGAAIYFVRNTKLVIRNFTRTIQDSKTILYTER